MTKDYTYSISFAVGLVRGRGAQARPRLGRRQSARPVAAHHALLSGTEDQAADPLIEEIEGAGNTPAYRGLSYVVFEDMALAAFGNRIPQLQFELIRSITADNPDALENRLRARWR